MEELKFSVDDVELFKNDDSVDFATAKIYFLSEGNNTHKNPISIDVLKEYANSALGKFIVAKFDKFRKDVTSHDLNEVIVGYIPPQSKITFEEKNGKIFAVAEAVISKLYATNVYKLFKTNNNRSVSCEFSATLGDLDFDGNKPILSYSIHGITILGVAIAPSCKNADMEIIKFSEEKANKYYEKYSNITMLKNFAEKRKQEMEDKEKYTKVYKVNESKDNIDDGTWDGEKTKKDAIEAKNFESIAPKIFMRLEDGWKDREITKLGYPVMTLVGEEFVYSKKGLASAKGYAEKENESSVLEKLVSIYKKLDLENNKKEVSKMSEFKFAVDLGRVWSLVSDKLEEKYPDRDYGSIYKIQGIFEENHKKFVIIHRKDETQLYRLDFDYREDGFFLSDKIIEVTQDFIDGEEVIKFENPKDSEKFTKFEKKTEKCEDDKDDDKDDDKETEDDGQKNGKENKKFSLDVNADSSAYLEMLQNETEKYRELGKDLLKEMTEDAGLVMKKYISMAKECDDLKQFKETKETESKLFEVNKTLMEAKDDLTEKEFEDLKEEGMACEYAGLNMFSNKVKALAYSNAKNKTVEKEEVEPKKFAKMAFDWNVYSTQSTPKSADEIFKKNL